MELPFLPAGISLGQALFAFGKSAVRVKPKRHLLVQSSTAR
ncbi:exported hypothetical protein [Vibrio coralliirubri]|nr:exported hypothetical protein [Vibrio coralliirubri]